MTEGLTDKMRCFRCGFRWSASEQHRPCPFSIDHSWVVPVEAVTQAIDAEVSADDLASFHAIVNGERGPSIWQQEELRSMDCTCEELTWLDTGHETDGPPAWVQDPLCPQHPDAGFVLLMLWDTQGALDAAADRLEAIRAVFSPLEEGQGE